MIRFRVRVTPLRYRLTSQSEFPVPLLPAIVRESKEIEGLRSPFPSCSAIHHREPAKLDESGLVWMQLKLKLAQPFLEIVEKPLRVLVCVGTRPRSHRHTAR